MATTIPASVMESVARHGAKEAVVEGVRRLTYQQLGERIIASTKAMMAAGVSRGDRVAVWAPNSLAWIVAALGAQSAGAALVPINTRWKGGEAAYVLAAANVSILCTSVGFLDQDSVAMLDDDPTPLPGLRKIVLLDGSGDAADGRPANATPTEHWADFEAAGIAISDQQAHDRRNSVGPLDASDIMFTSGTTGRPKGVVMDHGQTTYSFTEWARAVGLRTDDRYLIVNPFFHMFGYKAGWLASFLKGTTIFPMPVFDVPRVLAMVEAEKITVLPGAPTIYQSILAHPDCTTVDLSSLRLAVTGAADVPVALIEQVRAELPFESILTGYGLTEAGTVTISGPDDDAVTIATTAGRAIDGVEVKVVDADGLEVERGTTGEVLVRGYNVMQRYLDDDEATAAAIDADGFFHTGDLATMDERGYLRIVGRLKDMLIVGGFNVYPAEVENIMLTHPAIGQVSVIGIPDERMGEVAMAWIIPVAETSPTSEDVIAWCREKMANYKAPRVVRFVDSLPTNATGKVMKQDLRAIVASESQ